MRHHRRFRPRCRFCNPTVHRPSQVGFIPSCFLSSSECVRRPSCAALRRAACLGVSALFAVSPKESTVAGFPSSPLRSVHRFSQPLDGLLRLRICGLVSSRYHVQGFPFRGLVPRRSCTGSSPACAPLPFPHSRSPVARLPRSYVELRGFDPRSRGDHRGRWLALPEVAPLFGVSSSRFLLPDRATTPLRCSHSAHDLAA